ncbi:MAG TPA: homoserine O-succinyltransferase [Terracidiphilus sp.]|jgi:homoserine O-succinyltransferase|nr:homoserine O-succinyltransferase [Terracidiphilus sp.]
MPVTLAKNPSTIRIDNRASRDLEPAERAGRQDKQLIIGLLNNMSAIEATERQFTSLLESASHGFSILLKRYYMPEVAKSESAALYRGRHYESIESLWGSDLDGLIVTGREPLTSNLRDEPYWDSFVRVLEWARENTCSAIWSCLAAHAAVLHMDGIPRVRSEQKYSGIFDCTRVSDHPIAAKVPARVRLPHSRWNGLAEADLTRSGYDVITRADDAGVDCFIKQDRSLFVFFQGHPEYQSETLLLEYRRDVARFLRGDSVNYPGVPRGYFNDQALQELSEIQRQATGQPQEATLARLATVFSATSKENGWHTTASTFYRNWLEHISSEKQLREGIGPATTATSPADTLASAGAA